MTRLLRWAMIIAVAVVASVGFATPSWAHNVLSSVAPANNATVAPPERVTFTFSEPARRAGTVISVTAPDGTEVGEGAVQLVNNTVTQPLKPNLANGSYRVDWRVTSADGHPVSGRTLFTVEGVVAAAPVVTAAPVAAAPTGAADDFFQTPPRTDTASALSLVPVIAVLGIVIVGVLLVRRRNHGPQLR